MSGVDGVSIVDTRVARNRGKGASGHRLRRGHHEGRARAATCSRTTFAASSARGRSATEIRSNTVVGRGAGVRRTARPRRGTASSAWACAGCCPTPAWWRQHVRGLAGLGLVAQLVSRVSFVDNTVEDVGRRGIYLRGTTESEARGNHDRGDRPGARPAASTRIELELSSRDNRVVGNTIGREPRDAQARGRGSGLHGQRRRRQRRAGTVGRAQCLESSRRPREMTRHGRAGPRPGARHRRRSPRPAGASVFRQCRHPAGGRRPERTIGSGPATSSTSRSTATTT